MPRLASSHPETHADAKVAIVAHVCRADLPFGERASWILGQDNEERKLEFRHFWNMAKNDPLAPIHYYWHKFCVTGLG